MCRHEEWEQGVAALTKAAGFAEAIAKAAVLNYRLTAFDPKAMNEIGARYCYATDKALAG